MAAPLDDLDSLIGDLEHWTGEPVIDRYFFLTRVGKNWFDYPFEWEPFRDLAGGLEPPPGAMPIAVWSAHNESAIKEAGLDPGAMVHERDEPLPHVLITLTPQRRDSLDGSDLLRIFLETWVSTLRTQGLIGTVEPAPWFLPALGLEPADVSMDVRIFLGLDPSLPPHGDELVSETMRNVGEELGASDTTAFGIAAVIARRHPEYGAGRFGTVELDEPPEATVHPWETWRDSVVAMHDPSVLASSRHQVVDGLLFLLGLGLLEPSLRGTLERGGAWAPMVLDVDERAAPTGSTLWSLKESIRFAHGYQSDQVGRDDRLDILGEVHAVCEVITDPDVRPPLAVGLFGQWGSGKSFFMDRMRERVAELTTGPDRRRDLDVVQIRFNAWHYTDTSLWASLAVEIFERLADPEPVEPDRREEWLRRKGDPKSDERESLLQQLETYRAAKATLEAERDRLDSERDAAVARRDEARRQRRTLVEQASFTDVAGELATNERLQGYLDTIDRELGFRPAVAELSGLGRELRTTAGYAPAVWRAMRGRSWFVVLVAVFIVLTAATAGLLVRGGVAWLSSLATGAASLIAAVGAAAGFLRPAAEKVNTSLSTVETAIAHAATTEAALQAKRTKEEQLLDVQLQDLDHTIADASNAIARTEEKIAATESEIESLTIGRQLYGFLADRAAGYQKHQGVVGMLHRDFRFLDAQLRAYRSGGTRTPGLPAADRVVLYIDDLDRCPPDKVLEVLEAVHLLLALELFVVVVGVDPRWLQRSLRHQYRALVTDGDIESDPYLHVMPIEYLEKIFQIPLTLPAMGSNGFAALIASLAPSVDMSGSPVSSQTTEPVTKRRAATSEQPGGDRAPTRALLTVQPGSTAAGVGGSIDLTRGEVEFAQGLSPIVATPRAAKRLMNTYRLIRATQHIGSRSRFLGTDGAPGEFQAVLLLLAVSAGYPTVADRMLVALEEDAPNHGITTWTAFVHALDPGQHGAPPGVLVSPDLINPTIDDAVRVEAASWVNMHQALDACLRAGGLDELEPFTRWGRLTARFSFTL
jgi:hypothetical protein